MKRLLLWSLLLLMMACAGTSSTPQKAVAEVCEQLLDAKYDAVLDRMYEWNPQQDEGGEFDMAVWMEQMLADESVGTQNSTINTRVLSLTFLINGITM